MVVEAETDRFRPLRMFPASAAWVPGASGTITTRDPASPGLMSTQQQLASRECIGTSVICRQDGRETRISSSHKHLNVSKAISTRVHEVGVPSDTPDKKNIG